MCHEGSLTEDRALSNRVWQPCRIILRSFSGGFSWRRDVLIAQLLAQRCILLECAIALTLGTRQSGLRLRQLAAQLNEIFVRLGHGASPNAIAARLPRHKRGNLRICPPLSWLPCRLTN